LTQKLGEEKRTEDREKQGKREGRARDRIIIPGSYIPQTWTRHATAH